MIDINNKEDKTGININILIKIELNFLSEYGYVKVLKCDFESPSLHLKCFKEDNKFQGTVNV